jgi:hypothetical protein
MKTHVVLSLLILALMTTGSSCINDVYLLAVNLPISECFAIKAGPTLSFSESDTANLASYIDPSYVDKIKAARYYDIRVYVTGDYNGSVSGTGFLNNIPLITYSGTWNDFKTPRSIITDKTKIVPVTAGVNELLRVLNQFASPPHSVVIRLGSSGSLSGQTPVPAGLSLCVEIYAQVDAEMTN